MWRSSAKKNKDERRRTRGISSQFPNYGAKRFTRPRRNAIDGSAARSTSPPFLAGALCTCGPLTQPSSEKILQLSRVFYALLNVCGQTWGVVLDLFHHCLSPLQGYPKGWSPGLENIVPAFAYHFCLNLPATFSQPGSAVLQWSGASRRRRWSCFAPFFRSFHFISQTDRDYHDWTNRDWSWDVVLLFCLSPFVIRLMQLTDHWLFSQFSAANWMHNQWAVSFLRRMTNGDEWGRMKKRNNISTWEGERESDRCSN